jgi:hypothetical protein
MDKQFYRTLLILVNDKKVMAEIHNYANARIEILRDQLETSKSQQRISEIQGALAELRRIKTLRDEVIEGAK